MEVIDMVFSCILRIRGISCFIKSGRLYRRSTTKAIYRLLRGMYTMAVLYADMLTHGGK